MNHLARLEKSPKSYTDYLNGCCGSIAASSTSLSIDGEHDIRCSKVNGHGSLEPWLSPHLTVLKGVGSLAVAAGFVLGALSLGHVGALGWGVCYGTSALIEVIGAFLSFSIGCMGFAFACALNKIAQSQKSHNLTCGLALSQVTQSLDAVQPLDKYIAGQLLGSVQRDLQLDQYAVTQLLDLDTCIRGICESLSISVDSTYVWETEDEDVKNLIRHFAHFPAFEWMVFKDLFCKALQYPFIRRILKGKNQSCREACDLMKVCYKRYQNIKNEPDHLETWEEFLTCLAWMFKSVQNLNAYYQYHVMRRKPSVFRNSDKLANHLAADLMNFWARDGVDAIKKLIALECNITKNLFLLLNYGMLLASIPIDGDSPPEYHFEYGLNLSICKLLDKIDSKGCAAFLEPFEWYIQNPLDSPVSMEVLKKPYPDFNEKHQNMPRTRFIIRNVWRAGLHSFFDEKAFRKAIYDYAVREFGAQDQELIKFLVETFMTIISWRREAHL